MTCTVRNSPNLFLGDAPASCPPKKKEVGQKKTGDSSNQGYNAIHLNQTLSESEPAGAELHHLCKVGLVCGRDDGGGGRGGGGDDVQFDVGC